MTLDRRTFVALGAGALAAGPGIAAGKAGAGSTSFALQGLSYVVPAPVEKAWHAFTDVEARKIWWGHPTEPLKGALEVRPLKLIRSKLDHPGLPGVLEMTVTFAPADGGTLITHSYKGFGTGPVWDNARQTMAHGIHEMLSDMSLYLRTGAGFPRHVVYRSFDLLKGTREAPGGIEVFEVTKGTLAEEIGLQPGDTIVGLAGAGVFTFCDIHFAVRAFVPGDTVEVKWVRGNRLMSAKGKMTGTVPLRTTAAGK